MDKRLNIQLIIRPDCTLVAVDNSGYVSLGIDLLNHVMLEFLTYNEDDRPLPKTIRIRRERHSRGHYLARFSTEFLLETDGTYSYYKLVIPALQHFMVDDSHYANLYQELYFDDGKLYKSTLKDTNPHTYEEIKINREEVENYLDAYNMVQKNEAPQTFYCPSKNVFSVCKLQRCLVYLQRQLLQINCKSCGHDSCGSDETLRSKRDFLLHAMYVFDYLKDLGNFTEAQRVLDNLSSCGNICGNELENLNNTCNCGSSL